MGESQIVISALGQDKPGIVKALSKTVLDCGGNIADSRMTRLGDEFALIMLVEGTDKVITSIEAAMQDCQVVLELTIITKRTALKTEQEKYLPYQIKVVCMDQPGIVHDVTDYIAKQNINIETLDTSSYSAAHTGAPMFSLDMSISIPASMNVAQLKKDFLSFCDDLNLDAIVDPIKS